MDLPIEQDASYELSGDCLEYRIEPQSAKCGPVASSTSKRCAPRHEPTPEEIEHACSEIRRDWSDKERRKRSGLTKSFWLGRACKPSRVHM